MPTASLQMRERQRLDLDQSVGATVDNEGMTGLMRRVPGHYRVGNIVLGELRTVGLYRQSNALIAQHVVYGSLKALLWHNEVDNGQ
jgi:hypothetical protein